jgi:hypothetical protein
MNEEELKYQRAQKRVEALRGFYVHLGVYLFEVIHFLCETEESFGHGSG